MKKVIIKNEYNLYNQIKMILNFALKENKPILMYAYNGQIFLEHIKLIYHFGKIKNVKFKFINNDDEFKNYIKNNDLSNFVVVMSEQFIEENIKEYIEIKQKNLFDLFGINQNVFLFSYHKNPFGSNYLLLSYFKTFETILEDNSIYDELKCANDSL